MDFLSSTLKSPPDLTIQATGHKVWTVSYAATKSILPVGSNAIRHDEKLVQPSKDNSNSAIQLQATQLDRRPRLKTLPLPIELRFQIYNYLFPDTYEVVWRAGTDKRHVPSGSANILRVSSTIHTEASQVLYAKSVLIFDILKYHSTPRYIYEAKAFFARNIHLKVHCFGDCDSPKYKSTLILDRILHHAAEGVGPRRLEIDTNVHGFRRLAHVADFPLFRQFESIRIHACVHSAEMAKARDWLHSDSNCWLLAPAACREHMVLLLKRLRLEIGTVQVAEREERLPPELEWRGRRHRGPYVHIEIHVKPRGISFSNPARKTEHESGGVSRLVL